MASARPEWSITYVVRASHGQVRRVVATTVRCELRPYRALLILILLKASKYHDIRKISLIRQILHHFLALAVATNPTFVDHRPLSFDTRRSTILIGGREGRAALDSELIEGWRPRYRPVVFARDTRQSAVANLLLFRSGRLNRSRIRFGECGPVRWASRPNRSVQPVLCRRTTKGGRRQSAGRSRRS